MRKSKYLTGPDLLLEDTMIDYIEAWLKEKKWDNIACCRGLQKGIDVYAEKGRKKYIIEVKGAKGNPKHKHTTRKKFSRGQMNGHMGRAIIKVLTERVKEPNAIIGIALPDYDYFRAAFHPIINDLKKISINFLWISNDGKVKEE